MKKAYKVTGTVVEVLKDGWSIDKGQRFHLVNDNGGKSLWVLEDQPWVRIGHRVNLVARENYVDRFALVTAMQATGIEHDRSSIHPWFEGATARELLARILKEPNERLPRRVLGDHLANDQPFDGARFLGLAVQRSLDEQGTFLLPAAYRTQLAPFTCACDGVLFGRDPLKSDSDAAKAWLGMAEVLGEPVRGERPNRGTISTFIRCYADLWNWIRQEVGGYQVTNLLIDSILEDEGRPPFRTDWAEFLLNQNIRGRLAWIDTVHFNPPLGFHTRLGTRAAAAYLGMPVAELRRLNRAGIIGGETSILSYLHQAQGRRIKTGNDTFEQVDLENYLESHWVVSE